jgi:hypothetical protein
MARARSPTPGALYYFAGDTMPGQTTGQGSDGFGADWWVVTRAGKAIEN